MSTLYQIKQRSEGEFHDRGSKFLATLTVVNNEEEAQQQMAEMRKNHPKANHLCYAYRISKSDKIIENLSDDGEPTHSAGQPILRQLQAENLVNTLAMVIRYFGGVKLGVGGLMKAYKNSTQDAIQKAKLVEIKEKREIHLKVAYSKWGDVLAILDKENLDFSSENQADHAIITLEVELSKEEEIRGLFAALNLEEP